MSWVKQAEDYKIPSWLRDNLKDTCDCGGAMENFYNESGSITARRCSNPDCPFVTAQKIKGMCDILGVKGVGAKTGLNLIMERKLKTHFDAVPFIFNETPTITVYDLLRIMFIPGVDTGWNEIANKYGSLDEIYANYNGKLRPLLDEYKEQLYEASTKFNIHNPNKREFEPLVTGTVMISGNIRGLNNRNSFVAGINKVSRGLIDIKVSETKRKTGIMALIQEADTPNRGKAACALEAGIPIMTPDEFQAYVAKLLQKKLQARK